MRQLFSLFVVSSLLACPAPDDGNNNNNDPPANATPEDLAAALGDFFVRCFSEGFAADAEPTLVAIIAEQLRINVENSAIASLTSPGVVFDGAAARSCIGALVSAPCDLRGAPPSACDGVTTGSLPTDAECVVDEACVEGLSCFQPRGRDFCGVCRPVGALNDSCIENDCGPDLTCEDGICVAEEEPAPAFEEGDPCDVTFDGCDLLNTGLACVDSVCRPSVVVDVGEECDTSVLGAGRYCIDRSTRNFCVPDPQDGSVGTCEARPAVGETCLFGSICIGNEAVCAGGSCVAGGGDGQACSPTNTCQVAFVCEAEECVPQFTDDFTAPTCE